jgi:hypothetical protein
METGILLAAVDNRTRGWRKKGKAMQRRPVAGTVLIAFCIAFLGIASCVSSQPTIVKKYLGQRPPIPLKAYIDDRRFADADQLQKEMLAEIEDMRSIFQRGNASQHDIRIVPTISFSDRPTVDTEETQTKVAREYLWSKQYPRNEEHVFYAKCTATLAVQLEILDAMGNRLSAIREARTAEGNGINRVSWPMTSLPDSLGGRALTRATAEWVRSAQAEAVRQAGAIAKETVKSEVFPLLIEGVYNDAAIRHLANQKRGD